MARLQHGGKTYRPAGVLWEEEDEKPKAPFPWGTFALVMIVLLLIAKCHG